MYRPVLVTAPTTYPVTMDEVKAHVGANDFDDDDSMLQGFRAAAVNYLDGWTGILGRCLESQTWRQDFDDFCWRRMPLPLMPVISVSSVKYSDTSGAEQTISSANYNLRNDTGGAYVEFLSTYSFPALNVEGSAVRIEYIAGYTQSSNTSTIPDAIRTAILLLIGHWYANREAAVVSQSSSASAITLPFAVEALLAPFRRVRF